MFRRSVWLVIALVFVVSASEPSAQRAALRPIMREKLSNTQQLLEGVVTSNLQIIDQSSERLSRITYTEVASWQANAQPEYLRRASAFVDAVKSLRQAATDRNVEAAANEYSKLVSTCISCHNYVRDSRIARLELHP